MAGKWGNHGHRALSTHPAPTLPQSEVLFSLLEKVSLDIYDVLGLRLIGKGEDVGLLSVLQRAE